MQDHEIDDREALRVRAYFLWLAEGRPEDRHVEHWLEAESSMQPAEHEPLTEDKPLTEDEPSAKED